MMSQSQRTDCYRLRLNRDESELFIATFSIEETFFTIMKFFQASCTETLYANF